MNANKFALCVVLILLGFSRPVRAEELRVAVAANFLETAEALIIPFESSTGHQVTLISGSTGQLYAQIERGAPFEVLLAADQVAPARLEEAGLAVKGSRFIYAIGELTLWSRHSEDTLLDGPDGLLDDRFQHIALANPRLAPYGAAAQKTLEQLGLWSRLEAKFVFGQNIAQTFSLLASGAADAGFIAQAQWVRSELRLIGTSWPVPADLHPPIIQEAALLQAGRSKESAQRFLRYLKGESARTLIRKSGYETPQS